MTRLSEIEERLNHQPCCDHRASEYGHCSDCQDTGCSHPPYVEGWAEEDLRALLKFAQEVMPLAGTIYDETGDIMGAAVEFRKGSE